MRKGLRLGGDTEKAKGGGDIEMKGINSEWRCEECDTVTSDHLSYFLTADLAFITSQQQRYGNYMGDFLS